MKKRLQGFIAGCVVSTLVLTGTTVFADSIDALFNQINIKINGNQLAKMGDNYKLQNGEIVPYSISYKGTTYLPMRKVAELLGKSIQWDKNTNTANIKDEKLTITANGFEGYSEQYSGVYFGIENGQKLFKYSGSEQVDDFTSSRIYSKDGKYYLPLNNALVVLNVIKGNYITEDISGIDIGNIKKKSESGYKVVPLRTTYYMTVGISDISEPKKVFECSMTANAKDAGIDDGGVLINNEFYVCMDDLLKFFGFDGKLTFKFDDVNNIIVLVLNK